METSLNIGTVIKEILYRDEPLKNLVKNQVFPLIAEENTTFPFIVYRRNSIRKAQVDLTQLFRRNDIQFIQTKQLYNDDKNEMQKILSFVNRLNNIKESRPIVPMPNSKIIRNMW